MSNLNLEIKISRSNTIEVNRSIAIIRLDTDIIHSKGQLVMVNYYTEEDNDIDVILALGIKEGIGEDCYRIISISTPKTIRDVVTSPPDVSMLVHGETYLYLKPDDGWQYVTIDGSSRKFEKITGGPYAYYNSEDGYMWYFADGQVRREDDYYSRSELESYVSSEIAKNITGFSGTIEGLKEELEAEIAKLSTEIDDINTYVTNSIEDIQNSLGGLSTDVNERLDSLETEAAVQSGSIIEIREELNDQKDLLTELNELRFPIQINLINKSGSDYNILDQTSVEITYSVAVVRDSYGSVTENCDFYLNGVFVPNLLNALDEFNITLSTTSPTFTLEARLRNSKLTTEISEGVIFGYDIYFGSVSEGWIPNESNIKSLNRRRYIPTDIELISTQSNLISQLFVLVIPNIFPTIDKVIDINGLDYVNSYNISTVSVDSLDYRVLQLDTPVQISEFEQDFYFK